MSEQILLLIFAAILFGVGLYALLGKRNLIKILMGVEIMTIAVNIVFIALGTNLATDPATHSALALVFPLISVAVGAAVMALGLAIVINNYRHAKSVDADDMATLKR